MVPDPYFEWLYGQVASVTNSNAQRSYWGLLQQLYSTRFDWFISNDDNRSEDGRALREEFFGDDIDDDPDCSFLEMLIALARRVAYQTDGEMIDWFWKLMENIDLRPYNDQVYSRLVANDVDLILEQVMVRTYTADGTGGLFPLQNPEQDQRDVELWYQMSAYLLERMNN